MMDTKKTADSIGTSVFSKVMASVSHELKNAFAIINENNGLLEDLLYMSTPEQGVAPERIQSVVALVNKQVARSNKILKDVNIFAHSADIPVMEANLDDTLHLITALASRQADMKRITLSVECPKNIVFSSALFSFESLLYLLIQKLIALPAKEDILNIKGSFQESQITVDFQLDNCGKIDIDELIDYEIRILNDALQTSMNVDNNSVAVILPEYKAPIL